jgi:translation initiation factor 2A
MPAKSVLFDLKCKPIYEFGANHRNVAIFNPQGRIVCIAGFGNLAGDMDFWDLVSFEKISTIPKSGATFFEWAPNGKNFLTATLSPRLRVDNGYKLWHYNGYEIYREEFKELYQVQWRPLISSRYPAMRSLSPKNEKDVQEKPGNV